MLNHIYIRDFAIIDEQELDLDAGMSVLTGETGAGKSILLDAIGLTLGDRADNANIRAGAERAEIIAGFDISDCDAARAWLREHDLDAGDECQLRRVVTREGRSRAWINGRPATLQSLRELGETLIDIHGQHEHQSLLRREIQRALLDAYAGHQDQCREVAELYQRWRALDDEYRRLREAAQDRHDRLELLQFQVRELDELGLQSDEIARLDAEHHRLANAGSLLETCSNGVRLLYDAEQGAVRDQLTHLLGELTPLADVDERLREAISMLDEALIDIEEASDTLRRFCDGLELDPSRLQWVEERLGRIHDLARKHHVDATELPALHERLREELDSLDHADERLEALRNDRHETEQAWRAAATRLGDARRKAARRLNKAVTATLQQLGMQGAQLDVVVESAADALPARHGLDSIEYRVATNPGQPARPLARIASGGELSRIGLAIQVELAASSQIPTLIYDEVDSGIGGGVAEIVGRLLRELGESHQVLCVTHLPQVAAQAHHHLVVSKDNAGKQTRTRVDALTADQRAEELARMLGGMEITERSRAHAREMLERAKKAS